MYHILVSACPKLFFCYIFTHHCFLKAVVSSLFAPVQSKGESEEVEETGDSGEYNVYSTFQSHEPDFDYLKSLEIEEKINKIRWLPQQNAAHFLLSTNGEKPVRNHLHSPVRMKLVDPCTVCTVRCQP